ncbi:hypothetical protein ScalyP_jg12098 [Parmales sp. scaly parma]|nr:hypothetical protein ScalyP_jg12098 [Parmales sp. scaly parma]
MGMLVATIRGITGSKVQTVGLSCMADYDQWQAAKNCGKNYEFAHDGECSAGSNIQMYYGGDNDNSGTNEQKLDNCAKACTDKKSPLSGSWDGFTAKGFIMTSDGQCWCESAQSSAQLLGTPEYLSEDICGSWGGGCRRYACGTYKRYDFNGRGADINCDQPIAGSDTEKDAASALGVNNLKEMIEFLYADDGVVGDIWGCKDIAITKGHPHYLDRTPTTISCPVWDCPGKAGTQCGNYCCKTQRKWSWSSMGYRNSDKWVWGQCSPSRLLASVNFDLKERLFFGEKRYECAYGDARSSSAYDIDKFTTASLAFASDVFIYTTFGVAIAIGDSGRIDHKAACYSHYRNNYRNNGVSEKEDDVFYGFKLAADSNGKYINDCDGRNGCDGGRYSDAEDEYSVANKKLFYEHYDTPKFHNFGYDKPGGNQGQSSNTNFMCWHTNSDASTSSCQQTCKQDETIFNPGQSNEPDWIDRAIPLAVLKERSGANTYGGFAYGDKNVNAWISVEAPTPWKFAHDGECAAGSEIRMYEGNGDNKGLGWRGKEINCGKACLDKNWSGFTAKGFVMASSGRCYCESAESTTEAQMSSDSCASGGGGCGRYNCGSYKRYDFT